MASQKQVAPDQDYPLSEVPSSGRRSAFSLYFVLLGFTFFTATMFGGGKLGVGFNHVSDVLLVILIGNLLLGLYVAGLAYVSSSSGLNTVLLARFSFGSYGSALADLLLGITQIGWYAWGTGAIAQALTEQLNLNQSVPYAESFLIVFFGMAFCWTAYIGYRGLEILSWFAVPLMTALIFYSLYLAVESSAGPGGLLDLRPPANNQPMSYSTAITIVFGTFASGGTQVTNWTRFAPDNRTAVLASLSAFFIGNGLMILVGAIGAVVYKEPDVVQMLAMQGLLLAGTLMLFLNIWTTQDNTIYNFSVAGCNLLRTKRRRTITLFGAALGTLMALSGLHKHLVDFLIFLGVFIPPLGGVLMTDFFMKYKGKFPQLSQIKLPAFHISGLLAYTIGSTAALISNHYNWFIPPITGIVVAALLYALLSELNKTRSEI